MRIGELVRKGYEARKFAPSEELPLPNTLMGVEIEVERADRRFIDIRNHPFWSVTEEPMLRNNGREFIFATPLFGQDLVDALEFFDQTIGEAKHDNPDSFEFNHRTSVHAHIDVRDMEPEELFRMLMYYVIFERLLFDWIHRVSGIDRSENPFCIPYFNSADDYIGLLNTLNKMNRYPDPEVAIRDHLLAPAQRYSAVNFASLDQFGTLEFRQLHGTHEYDVIMFWIQVIQNLKRAAKKYQIDPDQLLAHVSGIGPREFLREVFPENHETLMEMPDVEWEIMLGVRRAQDMLLNYAIQEVNSVVWQQLSADEMVNNLSDRLKRNRREA